MSQSISGNTTTSISTNTINDSCKQSISKCAIVVIATAVAVVAIIVILATASALVSAIACPLIFVAVLITAIVLLTSKNATFVAHSRFPAPVLVRHPRPVIVQHPRPIHLAGPGVWGLPQPHRRQHPGDTLGHAALHRMAAGARNSNSGVGHGLAPMSVIPGVNQTNIPANQVGGRPPVVPLGQRPPVVPLGQRPVVIPAPATPFVGRAATGAHNHHGAPGAQPNVSGHHGHPPRGASSR